MLGLHGHLLRAGKQLFLGIAKYVATLAKDDIQGAAVELELRAAREELLHLRIVELEQFGRKPARRARDLRVDGDDLRGVVLVGGVARVLVELALRVVHELAELDARLVAQSQVGEQVVGRLRYRAAIRRELGRIASRLVESGEECLVIRVDAGEVPAIAALRFRHVIRMP